MYGSFSSFSNFGESGGRGGAYKPFFSSNTVNTDASKIAASLHMSRHENDFTDSSTKTTEKNTHLSELCTVFEKEKFNTELLQLINTLKTIQETISNPTSTVEGFTMGPSKKVTYSINLTFNE